MLASRAEVLDDVRHANKDNPYYMIKSDTTEHVAIHKGSALHSLGLKKK